MNPVIRDLLAARPELKGYCVTSLNIAAECCCPYGVVIGGTYLHFKGKEYVVLDVIRDADDWDGERLVQYVEKTDATHRCTRKLSHFLTIVDGVPRFKWIPK